MTWDRASMPVLRAFMEEADLPSAVRGPVDLRALRRLASICFRVDIYEVNGRRVGEWCGSWVRWLIRGEIFCGIGGVGGLKSAAGLSPPHKTVSLPVHLQRDTMEWMRVLLVEDEFRMAA